MEQPVIEGFRSVADEASRNRRQDETHFEWNAFCSFFFLQEALYMRRSENIIIGLVQEKTRTLQVDEAHV